MPEPTPQSSLFLLLKLMTIGLIAVTVLSLFAKSWWAFDLLCHFKVHYCIFLLVLLIAFGLCRSGRWAGITLLVLGFNLYPVVLSYLPSSNNGDGGLPLKIISLNVFSGNHQHQKVIDLIQAETPDVFFLLEYTPEWEENIRVLEEKYPYYSKHASHGNFGIACYSQQPLEDATLKELSLSNHALFVKFKHKGKTISLVGAHPYPPSGAYPSNLRNQQLKQLSNYLNEVTDLKIVVGDLNITPWSPYFQDFLSETNLFDSRMGFGIQATWNAKIPTLLRIPIDHCLLSKEFVVTDRRIGNNVGSDHLPVIVTVGIR